MIDNKYNESEIASLLGDIIVSPPRHMLKMFGGNMTIKLFREKSYMLKKQYRNIMPISHSINAIVEESVFNQDQNMTIKPTNKAKIIANNQEYALRRTKEIKNS